jgi:Ser/Thr protein kinase RdoA (MazF antagonist)
MEERLGAHLAAHYPIEVERLARCDEGVYRVERSDGPDWVARVFPKGRAVEQAEADAEVLRQLEAQGYPAERGAHERAVTMFDGQAVLVTEHAPGTMPGGDAPTARRLGELLGRLHALPMPTGLAARDAGALHHWAPNGGGPGEDVTAARSWLAAVEARVTPSHRALYDSLREDLDRVDDGAALPRAFVHPDFHRGNAIATPDGELVMIDWTGAGAGPRVASLGLLLFTAAAKPYPGDAASSQPDVARVDPVVAGYRERVDLDDAELAALDDAVLRPALVLTCFLFWLGVRSSGQPALAGSMRPGTDLAPAIADRARAGLGPR